MSRWVYCHLCGCTGLHRERENTKEYPCPNGCRGGRVYEQIDPEWFVRLVNNGAGIHEDASDPQPAASTRR